MPKWEYLEVNLTIFGFNNANIAAQFVNGQPLKDWKRVPLNEFINRLGADGWEMSGTISITYGGHSALFFKRPKP
ncbi:MAG: hypothetical protein ACR2H5_20845 [Ktedonobacteraceae bacterium]